MQIIRSAISLFLLLVYSISFTHDLIPHCHFSEATEQIEAEHGEQHHHLENHKHAKIEDLDDDDILHQNHLDDSLFDFLVCIFSELNHPFGLAHHHFLPKDDNSKNELSKIKLVATLVAVFNLSIAVESPQLISNNSTFVHQAADIISSPHRGPPFLSC